jgi:1,4-alpha-glucan branching enzyme
MDYGVADADLPPYVADINALFVASGASPIAVADARGASAQLKVLIDLLHVHGIAVMLDVVYNHAGPGFTPGIVTRGTGHVRKDRTDSCAGTVR